MAKLKGTATEKLNEYYITKDGKVAEGLMYDSCIGYSCAREEVRMLSERYPQFKWGTKKVEKQKLPHIR